MISTAQRTELQNKIWKIVNEVLGLVDGILRILYQEPCAIVLSVRFFKEMKNNTVLEDEHIIDIFDKKENIDYVAITLDNEKISVFRNSITSVIKRQKYE